MATQPPPSVMERVLLIPTAARAVFSALCRLFTSPLTSGPKADKFLKDVVYAAVRTQLSNITIAQEQWINGTSESAYLKFAEQKGFQPQTDVLDHGAKAFWLGSKSADKVLLYFHGGGYVLAATPVHFKWLFDLQNELSKKESFAVVVLGYTLAPGGEYPLQLKQAANALTYLVEKEGKKSSNIFVGGDSAGGNLALGLLSHAIHPHPDISPLKLSEALRGLILISPWVNFGLDASFERNATSDVVTPEAAKRWSSAFMGSSQQDNYNQPIHADAQWFSGLESKVRDVLVWGGGGEVLIDSIEGIAKKLKQAHPRTEYVVQSGASHEDFIIELALGYKNEGQGAKVIESWLSARL